MAGIKIGRRDLAALGEVSTATTYWDDALKGFGVLCRPSGERRFVVEYRPGAGGRGVAKRRVVVGDARTMTPEQARKLAADILAQVRLGSDPAADRQRERKAETVADLATAFLADHVEAKRKPATAAAYREALTVHVLPALGSRPAVKLTRQDVAKLHRALSLKATVSAKADKRGRSAGTKVRGGPVVANKVVAVLSSMYGWADRAGLVPEGTNPARRVERFREVARTRFLSDDELGRLGAALALGEREGIAWKILDPVGKVSKYRPKKIESQRVRISKHVASAIRLLLFTGARLREVLHVRWEHVDSARGVLNLPDSKTGAKTIVLNAPAVAVLAELPRVGPFVFPHRLRPLDAPMDNFDGAWRAVIRQAELPALRVHDLRHSHASVAVQGGIPLATIGRLLGHADVKTTRRYSHFGDDPLRRASEQVGSALAAALAGPAVGQGDVPDPGQGKVVPIRQTLPHG